MRAALRGLLITGVMILLSCGEDSRGNYADSVTRDFNACVCTEENGNRSWVVSCTNYPQSCESPTEEDITENLYVRCEGGGRVQAACTEGCGGLPVFCSDDTHRSVFSCPADERLLCVQGGIIRGGNNQFVCRFELDCEFAGKRDFRGCDNLPCACFGRRQTGYQLL